MLIAFIGCDGSGKSTLSKKLVSRLKKNYPNVEYRHQYNYLISNTVGKTIRKLAKTKNKPDNVESKSTIIHKLWVFVVYPNLLIDYYLKTLLRQSSLFVSDRYVYDMLIGWEIQGRLNFLSRFLLRNFPKPKYVFLIDAPPRILYNRRKDEYPSFEFCKKKRDMYLEFAEEKGIKIINTNRPITSSIREITKSIENGLL